MLEQCNKKAPQSEALLQIITLNYEKNIVKGINKIGLNKIEVYIFLDAGSSGNTESPLLSTYHLLSSCLCYTS